MALEGQARIGVAHALAVVHHLYAVLACLNDFNLYLIGTCVEGVFHQLLDDRRRTLNDFACCNLVGHAVWKQFDNIAHIV